MNLAESSWTQARDALSRTDLAIFPLGAVEVYGPHLPLGSDGIVAEAMARRLGERTGAIVLPLVSVGCSQGLGDFPGTLWVPTDALKVYVRAICESVVRQGIRRIFFIDGHLTNVYVVDEIARDLMAQGIRCAQVDWWRFAYRVGGDVTETGQYANGHASEVGTSVLLALREDLVVKEAATAELPRPTIAGRFPEIIHYQPYSKVTESGVIGDATAGSRQKGEAIVTRCLDRMEQFIREWDSGPTSVL